jgi:hypothetical protein
MPFAGRTGSENRTYFVMGEHAIEYANLIDSAAEVAIVASGWVHSNQERICVA